MSSGLEPGVEVAVLLRAIDPIAPGWLPSVAVHRDGAWMARVLVGSEAAPVQTGHRFEVVAVAPAIDLTTLALPLDDRATAQPIATAAPGVRADIRATRPR